MRQEIIFKKSDVHRKLLVSFSICFLIFGLITVTEGQSIITSQATGITSACVGSTSVSPNNQELNVSGIDLTMPITATAPLGFEVSITRENGFGNTIILTPKNGTVANTMLYVRLAASIVPGLHTGDLMLTSNGASTKTVKVSGIVSPEPIVNPIINQTFKAGEPTTAINFSTSSGATATYRWINDSPAIGLSESGFGKIPSFTPINAGVTSIEATITLTPEATGYAYVPDGTSQVSVINTTTNLVDTLISVGRRPSSVTVSPDGSKVYVANEFSDDVSVINTSTNTVSATFSVGSGPTGIAIHPSGGLLYVLNRLDNTVSAIFTSDNRLAKTISVGSLPNGIAASKEAGRIYVTNSSGDVSVISMGNHQVLATIPVGSFPVGVAVSPDGSRAYVANSGFSDNTISVINTGTNSVIATIPVGNNPSGVVVSPDGSRVYVSNTNSHTVSIIDSRSNAVISTVSVGSYPYGVSLNSDGVRLYVVNRHSDDVSVINTRTESVIASVEVGSLPTSMGNFVTSGAGCIGSDIKFTITIDPQLPTISLSDVTGHITACVGNASINPHIQRFEVSGNYLRGSINISAPTDFEISTLAESGYGNTIVLPPTDRTVSAMNIYVRSSSNASPGTISGDILLNTESGKSEIVKVRGTVYAMPVANEILDQTFITGTATTPIEFSGTANSYRWTNNNPSIGLQANGNGSIPSFIANNGGGNDTVVATITTEPRAETFAYIANTSSNNISVINTSSNKEIATIPFAYPSGVAINPNNNNLYAISAFSTQISIINPGTNTVVQKVDIGVYPFGIVMSPDGKRVYTVNKNADNIKVLNTSTNTVMATYKVGFHPTSIFISPDGTNVYVAHDGGYISVINTNTNSVKGISVGRDPSDLSVSPDGNILYVTNFGSNTVSVINTNTYTVFKTITVGSPSGIVLSADGSLAYVTNAGANTVSLINTSTNLVIDTIAVGAYPNGLSITPDGSRVYVVNKNSTNVSVIDTYLRSVVGSVAVGLNPVGRGNFITNALGCVGTTTSFTITINPVPPTIISSRATGAITACTDVTSQNGGQQFSVKAIKLISPVVATAPLGFEISTSAEDGFGSTLTLNPINGQIDSAIIYVRSSATASAGKIYGNVSLTSEKAVSQNVMVTGTITATPTIDPIEDQILTGGTISNSLNFSGSGGTRLYHWTNDNPSIGLPESGIGNIPSFTPINGDSSPRKANITVTPVSTGMAYIPTAREGYVWILNTHNNKGIVKIKVGDYPNGVATSPDGSHVYVVNSYSNNVSVINTSTNTVVKTISVGSDPQGVAVTPDGSRVYVVNSSSKSISVIDTDTHALVETIQLSSALKGIAISPNGETMYVATIHNTILVIAINSHAIIDEFEAATVFSPPIFSPDGGRLYVPSSNHILVVDTKTNTQVASVKVGITPYGLAVSPDGNHLYSANRNSNTVSFVNTTTYSVEATIDIETRPYGISVELNPYGISVTPDGSKIFVTSYNGTVNVIDTKTYVVAKTYVDLRPVSVGNFITSGGNCNGSAISFELTVNPGPTIIAGMPTGTIASCERTASTNSSQLFEFSGTNLVDSITVTAPNHFEIATNIEGAYANKLKFDPTDGIFEKTTIYVRSATSSPSGSNKGKVIISSAGAQQQEVSVASIITPIPALLTKLINGTVGVPYNLTISEPSIGYTFTATGLPSELVMSSDGKISGTPVTSTVTPINVTVLVDGVCPLTVQYELSIAKGSAVITLSNTAQVYDATAKSLSIATDPPGLPASVTYNGLTTLPVDAGSYQVSVTINDNDYTGAAIGTLEIQKATATLSISNTTQIYDGAEKSVIIKTQPADLSTEVIYNGLTALPTNAGGYEIEVSINDDNYTGTASATLRIQKATATVVIGNRTQIFDGKSKEITVITDPIDLPTLVTYNASTKLPINAGVYEVEAVVGDDNYEATISGMLEIQKAIATVSLAEKTTVYDGKPKTPKITTIPGDLLLNITFNNVASQPVDAGSYTVVATIEDGNYSGSVSDMFSIQKAPLTVTATNFTKTYGDVNPQLVIYYSGFLNGETVMVIDDLPVAQTSAITNSNTGIYPIWVLGGDDRNYEFDFVSGELNIVKANQTIEFPLVDNQIFDASQISLSATASSGLEVLFSVVSGPANISGNTLMKTGTGEVTIEALQTGNENYHSTSREQSFLVEQILGIQEEEKDNFIVFPNPARHQLNIMLPIFLSEADIELIDLLGKVVLTTRVSKKAKIDLADLSSGVYLLRISNKKTKYSTKIIVR